ncbi:formate dehydrogenase accessory protein FdhE [Shewanella sp. Choline-02u-19]|uniref:formate dehydrogenase accessory protein FdhE n=1 Tax=unclassified Shewanella TaxID=196818 RepID=UPI000C3364E2|nr:MULTISPECIES: formate dehydrogenase accessory protein FdhE [unclassified Shewanella]PKH57826.1 formate dehydrogenase accessory protein FdhE [Shewanella sp. Bg11-22]PKI29756.1 formate dehydrogenase accessory protein FdhE [Shewanella sp. Choline-02u-19]
MSTAILDAEKIPAQKLEIKTLIPADPQAIYQFRAARLAELAEESGLPDYFRLLKLLVSAQARVASVTDGVATPTDLSELSCFGPKPEFDFEQSQPMAQGHFEWGNYWQSVLLELISDLLPKLLSKPSSESSPESAADLTAVLKALASTEPETLQQYAEAMLLGHFAEVPAEYTLFIWAALSVYWSHWATDVATALATTGQGYKTLCPVCGCHPVASVIKEKPRTGLRYLHCSLCETEWHQIRAECTSCGEDKGVFLWAETETKAAVRIESCDTCKGYTKMLFTDINPKFEVAVDDLATLLMDKYVVEQGYLATTVNPLLLAHEQ